MDRRRHGVAGGVNAAWGRVLQQCHIVVMSESQVNNATARQGVSMWLGTEGGDTTTRSWAEHGPPMQYGDEVTTRAGVAAAESCADDEKCPQEDDHHCSQ